MSRYANLAEVPEHHRRQVEEKLAALRAGATVRLVQPLGPMPPEEKKKSEALRIGEAATAKLLWLMKVAGLPEPELEVRFHAKRRWRFDMAWPDKRLAVEIEGGIHGGRGRHIRPIGFTEDIHKYNAAVVANWRLIRVTHGMIHDGSAIDIIEHAYG